MAKLKIKNSVKKIIGIVFVITLFLSIGLYSYIKIKNQKEYEQTYEYKLGDVGYTENEVKLIIDTFQNKEIDYILTQEKNEYYVTLPQEKYFVYNNFYNYLEYLTKHSDENLTKVIEKVNTHTDKDYYTDSEPTDISKKELMLVNKYNYLDETYEPENLVSVGMEYAYGEQGAQKVTSDTYDAFLNMWNASHNAGFYLMVNSSYRTYKKQEQVYNDYQKVQGTEYADSIAARPGYSEHQTGYSLDIFEKGYSSSNFAESDSYKWLLENAHKYGFILRYPKDKVNITGYAFESWHFRYVGIKAATYIYENKITFDEYYAYFVK